MTKRQARKVATKSADATSVVRDSTFSRAVSDRVIVIDLGRDVELAFLQTGSQVIKIVDHGDAEKVELDPTLTEVTRMRMPWYGAVDTAMHILRIGAAKGSLNIEAVISAIREFEDESSSEDEGASSDE